MHRVRAAQRRCARLRETDRAHLAGLARARAIAPTLSSIGVFGSTRWSWYRSITSTPSRAGSRRTRAWMYAGLPSRRDAVIVRRRARSRTWSRPRARARRSLIARPTSSSFVNGPYMSAVSSRLTPSSSARWIVAIDSAFVAGAVEVAHAHAAEAERRDFERSERANLHAGSSRSDPHSTPRAEPRPEIRHRSRRSSVRCPLPLFRTRSPIRWAGERAARPARASRRSARSEKPAERLVAALREDLHSDPHAEHDHEDSEDLAHSVSSFSSYRSAPDCPFAARRVKTGRRSGGPTAALLRIRIEAASGAPRRAVAEGLEAREDRRPRRARSRPGSPGRRC